MANYKKDKQCEKCGRVSSVAEFEKAKNSSDGRSPVCKWCNGTKFDSRNKTSGEYAKQYAAKNREKLQAHQAVSNAVFSGKLPHVSSVPCDKCGNQAEHYHHESYEKENHLSVIPLCASCHKKEHGGM